jgi:CO/xanthine dehydrogenase Mo-binding subunit
MSIGAALYEKVEYGPESKITNPYFFKYHLPTYKEASERDVEFVEDPGCHRAFRRTGSKGAKIDTR